MAQSTRPDIRLTPQEQEAFLRDNRKAALATVDKDGFPHLVAMNYLYMDGAFWMTSYGKAQKVVNIRRNPRVALMVESGASYGELRGVMVRGDCEIIDEPGAVAVLFERMAAARPERRTQSSTQGASRSAPKRVVLKLAPIKTYSWDHTKLAGRY